MWTVSRGACTSEEAVAQDNGSNRGDTLLRGVCSLRCSCFDCVRCFALQVRQNKIGRAHAPCVFRGCFGHLHAASASWLFGSHQCLVQRFFSCVQPLRPASTVVGRCVSVLAQVCACATHRTHGTLERAEPWQAVPGCFHAFCRQVEGFQEGLCATFAARLGQINCVRNAACWCVFIVGGPSSVACVERSLRP